MTIFNKKLVYKMENSKGKEMVKKSELTVNQPVLRLNLYPKIIEKSRALKTGNIPTMKNKELIQHCKFIATQIIEIYKKRNDLKLICEDVVLLSVGIAENYIGAGYTLDRIFKSKLGFVPVASLHNGYLIEAPIKSLLDLTHALTECSNQRLMKSASSIASVQVFGINDILRDRKISKLWENSGISESGRMFTVWLVPYQNEKANERLKTQAKELFGDQLDAFPLYRSHNQNLDEQSLNTRSELERDIAGFYDSLGFRRGRIEIDSKDKLRRIIGSGTIMRIEPEPTMLLGSAQTTSITSESIPKLPNQPIVAIIDGGCDDSDYLPLQSWVGPEIVPTAHANFKHGNIVSRIVSNAKNLNPNTSIHDCSARFGTVQCIPDPESSKYVSVRLDQLIEALHIIGHNYPKIKVWNMSLNLSISEDLNTVSEFGRIVSNLARKFDVLPVISIGNDKNNLSSDSLLPPADGEASLTVGCRTINKKGNLDLPCDICCKGPGPGGLLKPEVSCHSKLIIDKYGNYAEGSTVSAALMSPLVAHTFENLKNSTPDLVKALLINKTDLIIHDLKLGWGTPSFENYPWECTPGSKTMLWVNKLKPGIIYQWNDFKIQMKCITMDFLKVELN